MTATEFHRFCAVIYHIRRVCIAARDAGISIMSDEDIEHNAFNEVERLTSRQIKRLYYYGEFHDLDDLTVCYNWSVNN